MTIKANEKYVRNLDMHIGQVNTSRMAKWRSAGLQIAFVLPAWLVNKHERPVSHFLVKDLTAGELTISLKIDCIVSAYSQVEHTYKKY